METIALTQMVCSLRTLITILTETMDFTREVGGGVVTIIVKILEGLEDELQLYFSQCLGHWKI